MHRNLVKEEVEEEKEDGAAPRRRRAGHLSKASSPTRSRTRPIERSIDRPTETLLGDPKELESMKAH